jgi:uncharacterized protein YabN with tetrapyrrole methylase and pyrophosphatase domain
MTKGGAGGSLTVVGTGIQLGQLTPDALAVLKGADDVVFLVAGPVTLGWLERLRPDARSVEHLYVPSKPRREIYAEIAEEMLKGVRAGRSVCAAFYGHPGVLVRPAHVAIAQARREGYPARMLPAVSSFDCLIADLDIDPGQGCQAYEATSFLVTGRVPDLTAVLVLWQLGLLGESIYRPIVDVSRMSFLVECLERFYPSDHAAIVYEASPFPVCDPSVQRIALHELAQARITFGSTLVVPPAKPPETNSALVAALQLS